MVGGKTVRKFSGILAVSALSLCLVPFPVISQERDQGASSVEHGRMTPAERRAAWESLSEEEKQAKREEMRAKRELRRAEWQAMTPEEREAKRAEMRKKWDAMTPEQREAMKQRRKQRGHRNGRRGDHGCHQVE